MSAPTALIGDALATWLNDPARSWPATAGTFTAARAWDETLDEKDAATASSPVVQIVMEAKEDGKALSRATWQEMVVGYIGLRQRYGSSGAIPNSWIDARVELLEAIEQAMHGLALTVSGLSKCQIPAESGVSISNLRDRIDQRVLRQYTGILEFRFLTLGTL